MKRLKEDEKIGITFFPNKNDYLASISYDVFGVANENIDEILTEASNIYKYHLEKMHYFLEKRSLIKKKNKFIPARYMWKIGNEIFEMIKKLDQFGLYIENLYGILSRDLKISKTVIKRLVSLRRYFPDLEALPEDLSWGKIKNAPKRFARKK